MNRCAVSSIEQSSHETCTSYSGLALIGFAINRHTSLEKALRSVSRRHGIPQVDLIRTYVGQLSVGKSDFDAIENVRKDRTFRLSLAIEHMPSAARLIESSRRLTLRFSRHCPGYRAFEYAYHRLAYG